MPHTDRNLSSVSRRRCLGGLLAAGLGLAGLASHAAAPAQPVTIDGARFDLVQTVAGQRLRLNGVGVRAALWLKGYAAGLYLPEPTDRVERAMPAEGAAAVRRLQLRMLMDAPATEFSKAFRKGVTRNLSDAQRQDLAAQMTRFETQVDGLGDLRRGDVIDVDLVPGAGLVLRYNGRTVGDPLAGQVLYGAVLAIFIGPKPMDRRLKAGLLGQDPA